MAEEKPYAIIKRYPRSKTGTFQYHEVHDLECRKDNILNLNSPQNTGMGTLINDKLNLQHEHQKRLAKREYIEVRLDELKESFEALNRHQRAMGMPQLEEYPRELLNERYAWEAKYDVNETVINTLEYRIKIGSDAEQEAKKELCLQFGLQQSTQQVGDRIDTIDGQKVSYNEAGEPYINDKNSPYNGELVQSYRNLAKDWKQQRKVRDLEKLMELQEECRQLGKVIPQQLPAKSLKAVNRASLPKMTDEYRVRVTDKIEKS